MLEIVGRHADSLLAVARRHSLCPDDAQDAYQRALEILLRHARRLEADGAPKWAHTVVKHEAMRLRAARSRTVGSEEPDLDRHEAASIPTPDEHVLAFDRMTRSAEALQRLKPQELRALWLKAQGHSYQEIAERCGWTYTKVNRCITEGRRSFLERYAGIEAGDECRRWEPLLSAIVDGEAKAAELAHARPHLRNCPACRATLRGLRESAAPLAALLPAPAIAAAAGRHAEPAGRLLGRVYEALVGPLHERAAMSAVKLQATTEAVTAGKMAAVAASAAALAGGGVAVDRAVERVQHHRARPVAARPTARATPPAVARPAARGTARAATLDRAAPPHPSARTIAAASRAEFGFDGGRSRDSRASAASADEQQAASEFAAASAASAEPAPSPAPAAPAPEPRSSSATETAQREFGG